MKLTWKYSYSIYCYYNCLEVFEMLILLDSSMDTKKKIDEIILNFN